MAFNTTNADVLVLLNILQLTTVDLKSAINTSFVLLTTFIILTMQIGFGMLQSGMVSRKNEANVIVKNTLDIILGGLSYFIVGYGLSFGDHGNPYFGVGNFVDGNLEENGHIYAHYFQQLAFSTTSTTIISGAVADRVSLKGYMVFAFIFTGFIYPIPAHWIWNSQGWLNKLGAYDFAGCATVHISGGAAALIACIMIGPRLQKYDSRIRNVCVMASPTNVMIGTLYLWFGWIGFNCGTYFILTGGLWKLAGRTAVVTMNGAIGGGIAGVLISGFLFKKRDYLLDIPQFSAGILGGLVSVTSIASSCESWEGLIIGFIGGMVSNGSIALLQKAKVDDPVGAIGVHLMSGYWGIIAVGLFGQKDPVAGLLKSNGVFRGGDGKLLGYNILAAVVTSSWSALLSALLILILKKVVGYRLTEENELRGSDDVEHNIKNSLVILQATQTFHQNLQSTNSLGVVQNHQRKRFDQFEKVCENKKEMN